MQLLAAWLVGLLAIDSCFLLAAAQMAPGSMELSALVWAAILNVPIFLGALFLLQTRFRPELQEDMYYSTYINQKTNQTVSVTRDEQRLATVLGRIERVENLIQISTSQRPGPQTEDLLANLTFGINEHFVDKEDLSKMLFQMGVKSHTWFGGLKPPEDRVVSISQHVPKQTRDSILALIGKLGFTQYNLFDNQLRNRMRTSSLAPMGPATGKCRALQRDATLHERHTKCVSQP